MYVAGLLRDKKDDHPFPYACVENFTRPHNILFVKSYNFYILLFNHFVHVINMDKKWYVSLY